MQVAPFPQVGPELMGTATACINEPTLHARVGSLGTHGIERQVKQWLHKVFRRCVHIEEITQPKNPPNPIIMAAALWCSRAARAIIDIHGDV